MPETVGRAARAFWGVAWKEAQQEVKGERDALDAVRRELDRDRRDMSAEIARLEAETAHQAEALARLQEELKEQTAAQLKAEQAGVCSGYVRFFITSARDGDAADTFDDVPDDTTPGLGTDVSMNIAHA
jgi:alanyl-tRNA synthetase